LAAVIIFSYFDHIVWTVCADLPVKEMPGRTIMQAQPLLAAGRGRQSYDIVNEITPWIPGRVKPRDSRLSRIDPGTADVLDAVKQIA
jgi:hypothetical protein